MESEDKNRDILHDVLNVNNTSKFYIEHHGFMSNHMPHGIIALHGLGADRGRLQQYVDWEIKHLEASDGETATDQCGPPDDKDGLPHPGSRHSYYKLLDHYKQRLEGVHDGDLMKFVSSEFPALSPGLAGSALHALIHLGYGYSCGDPGIVCEGMAYLHHSYLPQKVPSEQDIGTLWKGTRDIVDVLEDVRQNRDLLQYVIKEARVLTKTAKKSSYMQNRLRVQFADKTEDLFRYATQIKLPDFVKDGSRLDEARLLGRWLMNCAVELYVRSERANELFLLHGVTGAWSLLQLLPALRDPRDVISACVTLLITLLAVYIAEECPPLNNWPAPDRLQFNDWSAITEAALTTVCDVHFYKLVQVTYVMSKDCRDKELVRLYKTAANIALTNDLAMAPTR